jgi:hypothetical protein
MKEPKQEKGKEGDVLLFKSRKRLRKRLFPSRLLKRTNHLGESHYKTGAQLADII